VSGASIYTLSEKASNETARRLAEKENAADLIAGLANVPASDEDQVRSILLDLVHRETANFSFDISNLIARNFTGRVPLARDPQRSAAFRVLKQAETPAVLIELGYMSNEKDLSRLSKAEWQQQVAHLIAQAIDTYFARRKRPGGR
jgi:N-acetylmuramoyl-L-alanine amidase